MRSIKTKLLSLGMAGSMLLTLAGCNLSTPSSVGTIGDVEIPAGVYLLAQYNAYNTASGLADLATGETANDVKAVLKAECTGTIGDEEVTATGAEYIEKLTMRAIRVLRGGGNQVRGTGCHAGRCRHLGSSRQCGQHVGVQRGSLRGQRHRQNQPDELPVQRRKVGLGALGGEKGSPVTVLKGCQLIVQQHKRSSFHRIFTSIPQEGRACNVRSNAV